MNQVPTGEPTAPTTAIADSDTTIAPVTSGEPAAEVNQVTSSRRADGAGHSDCAFGYDARHVDRRAGHCR